MKEYLVVAFDKQGKFKYELVTKQTDLLGVMDEFPNAAYLFVRETADGSEPSLIFKKPKT